MFDPDSENQKSMIENLDFDPNLEMWYFGKFIDLKVRWKSNIQKSQWFDQNMIYWLLWIICQYEFTNNHSKKEHLHSVPRTTVSFQKHAARLHAQKLTDFQNFLLRERSSKV